MSSRYLATLPLLLVMALSASGAQAQSPAPKSGEEYKPRTLSPAPAPEMKVVDQGLGVSVTQSGRGKLLVAQDLWDFGWAPQDAHITHRYLIQNEGDDTLFIEDVKPTCGCTVASLEKNRLAPGEKVPVTITVATKKFSGVLTKKIHVVSSDKESPRFPLTFRAHVAPSPDFELSNVGGIELGTVTRGEERSHSVSLKNKGGAPLQVQIAEAPPYLKASLSNVRLPAQGSIEVTVATGAQPPKGPIQGSLTLEMSGVQTSRLTIPITGTGVAN